jgi:16S rRNA (uracil1498-N3)-methyltransferase
VVNLLLFEPAELGQGTSGHAADVTVTVEAEVELAEDDRRARHLRDVLRVQPGQIVRAGAIRGPTGRAEVVSVDAGRVRLRVILDRPGGARPPIELILAVPRPKILPRVLETAASFGVACIDLVNAWRVERSYLSSPRLEAAELAAALRRGCEQGGVTWVPDIELHRLLMPFLGRARWPELRLLAHPRAASPIESALHTPAPAVIAIGPEGGWIDREVDTFTQLGFTPVHLGTPVLRVDAAVAALLAQAALLARLKAAFF